MMLADLFDLDSMSKEELIDLRAKVLEWKEQQESGDSGGGSKIKFSDLFNLDGKSKEELLDLRAKVLEWKEQQESGEAGDGSGAQRGLGLEAAPSEFGGETGDTEPEESALDEMLEDIGDEEPGETRLEEIDEEEPGEPELDEMLDETDDTGKAGSGSEDQPVSSEFTPEQDEDVAAPQDQDATEPQDQDVTQQDQDVTIQPDKDEQRQAEIEAMVDAYIEHLADNSENDDEDIKTR